MNVLITGTSSGIGLAIALKFLKEQHNVIGFDVKAPASELAVYSKPSDGCTASYQHYIIDVRDQDSFPDGILPDILINCAGVQQEGDEIDVNLKGTILITEKYAFHNPNIKSVVNIGSASAHTGSEFPEYAASKGGIISYTKNVALRLAPEAICNSIDPGGVITSLNDCVMNDKVLWDQIMELTPLKRWAEPEEIADWVYFVAVVNRFMTGQNLLIDGGEAGYCRFIWPE